DAARHSEHHAARPAQEEPHHAPTAFGPGAEAGLGQVGVAPGPESPGGPEWDAGVARAQHPEQEAGGPEPAGDPEEAKTDTEDSAYQNHGKPLLDEEPGRRNRQNTSSVRRRPWGTPPPTGTTPIPGRACSPAPRHTPGSPAPRRTRPRPRPR